MLSFFGEQSLKDAVVARVKEHQRLDQITQGQYWEQDSDGIFRGCGIGCVLHSGTHIDFERQLGLPIFLAYMDEHIFESLPLAQAKWWPLRLMEAMPVGVDLTLICPRFIYWLLSDPDGIRQHADSRIVKIIDGLIPLYMQMIDGTLYNRTVAEMVEVELSRWRHALGTQATAMTVERAARALRWEVYAAQEAAGDAAYWAAIAKRNIENNNTFIHREADYLISLLQSYESKPVPMSGACEERHPWLVSHTG